MKVAIVYSEILIERPDIQDTIEEIAFVIEAIGKLGYEHNLFPVNLVNPLSGFENELEAFVNSIKTYKPAVIFNLIEEIDTSEHVYSLIMRSFKEIDIPYTGSSFGVIHNTTNKVVAKNILQKSNIPTPHWNVWSEGNTNLHINNLSKELFPEKPFQEKLFQEKLLWMVKPVWEDGSVGIGDFSVLPSNTLQTLTVGQTKRLFDGRPTFFEQYIDGREFNVSLLEHIDGYVEILPVSEIVFNDWPTDKPKIVDYKAKWESNSFEYANTPRVFDCTEPFIPVMKDIALTCWQVFNLNGYARVDMRVDSRGNMYVLEINTNPCIGYESGFIASCARAGYGTADIINRIINVALKRYF
ncbi:MAG: hypothetical protein L3V56_05060 [Candidatus Magnetoovum sp. WYHC-5]|nr:hypothetical protein [Candidatus Magnetoovum sp. WYHC-5]